MSLDSEVAARGGNKFKYKFKGVLMETIFSRIRLPLMALRCFSPPGGETRLAVMLCAVLYGLLVIQSTVSSRHVSR